MKTRIVSALMLVSSAIAVAICNWYWFFPYCCYIQEMKAMEIDLGYLPTLYAVLLFDAFYVYFIISLVLYLSIGVWSWVIIGACVAPVILASILVNDERVIRSLQVYEPVKVNFEVSLNEYVQLIKRENKNP